MREVDAPNDPLVSILKPLEKRELAAIMSFKHGPHTVSRARKQILVTL